MNEDDSPSSSNSFSIVVVGSGGGPMETDLSGYLLKAASSKWADGTLMVEGGSGVGALARLIETNPALFPDVCFPPSKSSPLGKAAELFSYVQSYLITHAHLDHVASLVMGTAGLNGPSTRNVFASIETLNNLEVVFGGGVWPDIAGWDMHQGLGRALLFQILPGHHQSETPLHYTTLPVTPFSVCSLPVSHGIASASSSCCHIDHRQSTMPHLQHLHNDQHHHQHDKESSTKTDLTPLSASSSEVSTGSQAQSPKSYESSAFFIRNDNTAKEFLFFGDVEPDCVSAQPRLKRVWEVTASKIALGLLDTIFIECSYLSSRPDSQLYGHLTPKHLIDELHVLSDIVSSLSITPPAVSTTIVQNHHLQHTLKPLQGVKICVMHCKEDLDFPDDGSGTMGSARRAILREVKKMDNNVLGVDWIEVVAGMRIDF